MWNCHCHAKKSDVSVKWLSSFCFSPRSGLTKHDIMWSFGRLDKLVQNDYTGQVKQMKPVTSLFLIMPTSNQFSTYLFGDHHIYIYIYGSIYLYMVSILCMECISDPKAQSFQVALMPGFRTFLGRAWPVDTLRLTDTWLLSCSLQPHGLKEYSHKYTSQWILNLVHMSI